MKGHDSAHHREVTPLCIAHLMRDLKYVEEESGDKWATRMKKLLKIVVEMVNKKKESILSDEEYKKLVRIYRTILSNALLEISPFPASAKGV